MPGHREGDLILGLGSSAIGTLVERTTRFTMLLHLPRMPGHGDGPRVRRGPALAGHGAEAVRDAIARTIATLPEQLRRSLTWDQGAAMSKHADLRIETGLSVYFCDPHSPWQRGSNENTNGLLRQYFPKGTDLAAHGADEIAAVAHALNARPRKTLGGRPPAAWTTRPTISPSVSVTMCRFRPLTLLPASKQLEILRSSLEDLDALIVDSGGVGQLAVEMIEAMKEGLPKVRLFVPAVITGGNGPHTFRGGRLTTPKRTLIAGLISAMGEGRLHVLPDAPGARILREEMAAFSYVKGSNGKRMGSEARCP